MEDKPIANYDRLGLLDEDLDDDDPSELVAGKAIALGKFLATALNQPLLGVTIKGRREIEITKVGRGYTAKFKAKKTELPGADCSVDALEMSKSRINYNPRAMLNPLPIKYFAQTDNKRRSHDTCNSSACWMAALYLNPALWAKCAQSDNADYDFYLPLVEDDPYDHTTDHSSQTAALKSLGIDSTWRVNFSLAECRKEIDDGRPVVIGLLHKGPVSAPTGGGHMILLIGHTPTGFIVHDPNGDLDLVNGGYPNWASGANLTYSERNLSRRSELNAANRYTPGQNLWCRTFQTNRP